MKLIDVKSSSLQFEVALGGVHVRSLSLFLELGRALINKAMNIELSEIIPQFPSLHVHSFETSHPLLFGVVVINF